MNQYQYDTKVIQEWVDHNGHMNDAEYNRVLSDATDDWLAHLGLTLETIKTLHYTVFTLENHLTFLKEMKLDEKKGPIPSFRHLHIAWWGNVCFVH